MSIVDDLTEIVRLVRKVDKLDILDEVLDRLLRLRAKVQDLVEENRRLRKRLRALKEQDVAPPYEGVYWFDSSEI